MTSRTSKAFRGTVASLMQYAIFIILQVILTPLILKIAGQEVLGAYSIIMQIVGYGILLDLGFSVALSRFLSQTYGLSDQGSRFSEVFTIGRVFLLITNLSLAALIVLVALNIGDLIVASESILDQAQLALYFLAAWTVIRTPLALYNHGLMATQNMAAANIIAIAGNMSRLTLSLLLVYTGFGLVGLIAANILSEAVSFAMQMKHFRKKYPNYVFGWKVTDNKLFREMFSFGVKYWGVNLAGVLFLGSDSIIVGNLYSASAASVFYTTKIPAFLLFQFIFRLSDNVAPATNELVAQGNFVAVRSAYLKILRYSLLLAMPLAIGIIGFNETVITVWVGAAQYAGDIMSLAIAVFVLTQVVNHINAMITLAAGDMRRWATVSVLTSLMSLALSYWLGKVLGMQWVMVAIALMDIPNAIFLFKRSIAGLKLSVMRIWQEALVPVLWVCLPLCGLVVYLKATSSMHSLLSLVLYIMLFSMLWVACLLLVGLSRSEKEILRNKCQVYLS
ncbi:MAG: oligosaccharide flippase family protein [Nitrosomonadales bacterium]|nr:oligosaccharide flippase family protein [Nitrosomonadales bacterium]